MIKYNFQNDYSEGAHPRIIEALAKSNLIQEVGYGEDRFSLSAIERIRAAAGNPQADIHLVSGGTQANALVLDSFLRPFESVIAVDSGHICVHETGAIEATGHKINAVKGRDGKITPEEIQAVVDEHYFEHMVKPRAVYISQSTEVGTIYSAKEMRELSVLCKKFNLILYVDGARLGCGLTSSKSDLDLKELSSLVDVFYIGGTKNGALIGEAIVINNPLLKPEFRYCIKQHGALLAKGRLLGIQFDELFKDNLFYDLARHANSSAESLVGGISKLGYGFLFDSPTNQIFPIFPNRVIEKLNESYLFYVWSKVNADNSSVRLVTSWATPEQAVKDFLQDLAALS
ncbi:MAG: aminotransferase class V-fold PLP-dependent enzyme [Leptolinea sp.]|jgi:threonine aldolase|nr:aminotransferase class V-fold PLP-dependent enzyme [Leptolinea sp.]